jgi:RimJ/RimL family protein N-acetyltransferase
MFMKDERGMEFELQPTLRGELLEVRPLRREDFDELFRAASDPLIWELHPDRERYKEEPFRRYFDSGIASGGAFAIVERKTGRIIGSSRYHDVTSKQVEIGFTFLERAFWGGEYNGELKKLMLDHAFRFVERVVLVVGEDNVRSRRAVEKIGGKLVAVEDRMMANGQTVRHVVYAVERGER